MIRHRSRCKIKFAIKKSPADFGEGNFLGVIDMQFGRGYVCPDKGLLHKVEFTFDG